MQADAFNGYNELYRAKRKPAPILEAACWSHGRRKFFDLAKTGEAPIAAEAVRRIDELFEIERAINGKRRSSGLPYAVRNRDRSSSEFEIWMRQQRALLSPRTILAKAINYRLNRWVGVHPLPRRRSRLSDEQCRGTSLARRGGREKELDLRRFRCRRPSRRRRLHPDGNLQDERCRPASLAR